jgi:integrase/predicted DNA-binding transcriptional regulator AlpA
MSREATPSLWPRGLSREQAATYIGVGTSKFDEMVRDGRMPRPKTIDCRVVWDRCRLDAAFDDLPDKGTDESVGSGSRHETSTCIEAYRCCRSHSRNSVMTIIKLKYTVADVDRFGNVRHYYRKDGKKIRLPGLPGSDEFMAAYQKALNGSHQRKQRDDKIDRRGADDSLKQLCEKYFFSSEWKILSEVTRRRRRALLDRLCERHGHKPYRLMERRHVIALRDELSDTPHGANSILKAMSGLFRWAFDRELVERNVMRDVPRVKTPPGGWHTWTLEEVQQYEGCHPVGTRPRLALALLMFTGQRRSDVVRLGKQHRTHDVLTFTQAKNENRRPVRLAIPILPELDRILAATPSSGLTFLETAYGKPFSAAGFGMRFREWCDQASLKHCSAHGLRKAAATIAAEHGATPHQLMAIFGWTTLQQAELYTRAASQKRLAKASMHMIVPSQNENKSVPLRGSPQGSGTVKDKK